MAIENAPAVTLVTRMLAFIFGKDPFEPALIPRKAKPLGEDGKPLPSEPDSKVRKSEHSDTVLCSAAGSDGSSMREAVTQMLAKASRYLAAVRNGEDAPKGGKVSDEAKATAEKTIQTVLDEENFTNAEFVEVLNDFILAAGKPRPEFQVKVILDTQAPFRILARFQLTDGENMNAAIKGLPNCVIEKNRQPLADFYGAWLTERKDSESEQQQKDTIERLIAKRAEIDKKIAERQAS